jgi:hypothetical protein
MIIKNGGVTSEEVCLLIYKVLFFTEGKFTVKKYP